MSLVVANIYMEVFEDLALRTTPTPRIWKRYVDDTFCMMEKKHTQTFLDHLNSLRPTIQFTMELEKDGSLPFLDTLLTRWEDDRVNIGVYRKTTGTNAPPCTREEGSGILSFPLDKDCGHRREHWKRREIKNIRRLPGETEKSAIVEHAWAGEHHPA